jgi:phosphoserine phosphatase
MKKIALFDFDNTVYDGYTFEDFINFASENILKNNIFQDKVKNILKVTSDYNDIVFQIAGVVGEIIEGWSRQKFKECCKVACNKNKILDWVIPVTKFLKLKDFENIFVTASFEEMLTDSLKVLPIDKIFCSHFELANQKYTGKIKVLLNDDKKVDAIKDEISKKNIFSIAFGDSMGDALMLNSVDLAFLVRSHNSEVEDAAEQNGWFLGSDPDVIIEKIQERIE